MKLHVFLAVLAASLYAQNGVFFESDPFGSFVVLNGRLLQERTPFLMRDLRPGSYVVVFFKEGNEQSRQTIYVPATGFIRAFAQLESNTVALSFTEQPEFVLMDQVRQGRGALYRLQQGGYRLLREKDQVRVDPIFSEEGQMVISSWLLPLTIGAGAALTIRDINSPWLPTMPLSPATLASYALALFNIGWFVGLNIQRNSFYENLITISEPVSSSTESAKTLFQRGQLALDSGNFVLARNYLSRVLQEHPQDPLAAQALFLLSRLAAVRGDLQEAKALYRMILHIYPIQEIYDRTVKVLADMAYASNDKEEVRSLLSLLTFSDKFLTPEDVEELKKWVEAP